MPTARAVSAHGSSPTACAAPNSALYFRPDGKVAACCGSWHLLGSVAGPDRMTLREIWDSESRSLLSNALSAGDYGYGCWECGQAAAAGDRSSSLAASFDRYMEPTRRDFPAVMDFALSNRCNLQCVMCNGGLSSTIRSQREHRPPLTTSYGDDFFAELKEFLHHLERAQFKGGEPFLTPENFRIWDDLVCQDEQVEVCVTTNGTVWSPRIENYVRELSMEVILSIDAIDRDLLQRIRVGVNPDILWSNIMNFRNATAAAGSNFSLSMCLMSNNFDQLAPFLIEADRLEASPKVIWVHGPKSFSLEGSPQTTILAALRCFESQHGMRRQMSDVSGEIFDHAVGVLQSAAASSLTTSEIVEMPVGIRSLSIGTIPTKMDLSHTDTDSGSSVEGVDPGSDSLNLTYENEVVVAVSCPDWAEFLHPEGWHGIGLDETMSTISDSANCPVRFEVRQPENGVFEADIVLEKTDSEMKLEAKLLYSESQPGMSLMVINLVATRYFEGTRSW